MQCISECCLGNCPHSSACRSCNARKCNPGFISCAGVNPARRLEVGDVDVDNSEGAAAPNLDADVSGVTTVAAPDALVPSVTSNISMLESAWGGACVGQHGWNTDFAHRMYQCGLASGGQQPAAGTCMAGKQHVSGSCGRCLGDLIHCGMQCISECCLGNCPHSSACRSCNARKCNPAFTSCAGVNPARRLVAEAVGFV